MCFLTSLLVLALSLVLLPDFNVASCLSSWFSGNSNKKCSKNKWLGYSKLLWWSLTESKRSHLLCECSADFQYECQLICVFQRPGCQKCCIWKGHLPAIFYVFSPLIIIPFWVFCVFFFFVFSPWWLYIFTQVQKRSSWKVWCMRYRTGKSPNGNKIILHLWQFSPLHVTEGMIVDIELLFADALVEVNKAIIWHMS